MSKVLLIPVPPEEIRNGLYNVIGGTLAGGAPPPTWVAVDDGTDAWVTEISNRPAAERARSVIAAANDLALVRAHRLGIGGAMRLPPSSLGALEAFSAADAAEAPVMPDCATLDMIDGGAPLRLVTIDDRPFWRAQLGDPALAAALVELAATLEVPASVLPWPALIVAEREEAEIFQKWTEISPVGAHLALQILPLAIQVGEVLDTAYSELLNATPAARITGSGEPGPVHELPHGRRVGWWSRDTVEVEEEGWRAMPFEVTPSRCRWRMEGADRGGIVTEVLTADEVLALEGVAAVRIPGWLTHPLRRGGPAGLLTARIADIAARRDLPLWVPGIDEEALRFVLGLPGTIWVDGPAVPK